MGSRVVSIALLALSAAWPAAAHASVAYVDENGIPTAEGEPGEVNGMTAAAGGAGVIFTDTAGIRPRDDTCSALPDGSVTCPGDSGGLLLGRDGNDTLRDAGVSGGFGARGGLGDDTIVAGAVDAIVYGDEREVDPADGDDTITGSSDTAPHPDPAIDFDDFLNGGGGDDTIDAGPGRDHAAGQAGDDTVDGGPGDDNLDGTGLRTIADEDAPGDVGNDALSGGDGDDQVNANIGRDRASGGDGNDYLIASDVDVAEDDAGVDTLTCGAGADRFAPGFNDKVAVGCETLLVSMYCTGGYPCAAKGSMTGRAKGAKKDTVVAKLSTTIDSAEFVSFKLGKKATKVLGTRKKVVLRYEVLGRKGKKIVSSRYGNIYLTP